MILGKMPPILKSYILRAIRQAFPTSEQYTQCKERNRREYPRYKKDGSLSKKKDVRYSCEHCHNEFKSNEVEVDHKNPVVQLYESANDMSVELYVNRVFCSPLNLQLLCKACHKVKTDRENKTRKPLKSNKFPKKKPKKIKF